MMEKLLLKLLSRKRFIHIYILVKYFRKSPRQKNPLTKYHKYRCKQINPV